MTLKIVPCSRGIQDRIRANELKVRKTDNMALPSTFVVALFNWRKLTNEQEQLRIVPLMEGLATATAHNVDVVLSTELGTTRRTQALAGSQFSTDWGTGNHATW